MKLKIFQDSQSRNVKTALFGTLSNTAILDVSSTSLNCNIFKLLVQADNVYYMVSFDNITVTKSSKALENVGDYF